MGNLTKCVICGKEYNYCPNCAGTNGWRLYTDTHEHYQIFTIFQQYNSEVFDKEKASEAFKAMGITADSDLSNLKPNIMASVVILGTDISQTSNQVFHFVSFNLSPSAEKPCKNSHLICLLYFE